MMKADFTAVIRTGAFLRKSDSSVITAATKQLFTVYLC